MVAGTQSSASLLFVFTSNSGVYCNQVRNNTKILSSKTGCLSSHSGCLSSHTGCLSSWYMVQSLNIVSNFNAVSNPLILFPILQFCFQSFKFVSNPLILFPILQFCFQSFNFVSNPLILFPILQLCF